MKIKPGDIVIMLSGIHSDDADLQLSSPEKYDDPEYIMFLVNRFDSEIGLYRVAKSGTIWEDKEIFLSEEGEAWYANTDASEWWMAKSGEERKKLLQRIPRCDVRRVL